MKNAGEVTFLWDGQEDLGTALGIGGIGERRIQTDAHPRCASFTDFNVYVVRQSACLPPAVWKRLFKLFNKNVFYGR